MVRVWPTIERFITEHGAAIVGDLSKLHGSSPREVGARMIVRPDGVSAAPSAAARSEWLAFAEAQQMMAGARARHSQA